MPLLTRPVARARAAASWLGITRPPRQHADISSTLSRLHDDERSAAEPLRPDENALVTRITIFGGIGAILMAFGALGVGAFPVVDNPVAGRRVIGLLFRMQGTAVTVTMVGVFMLIIGWVLLGRYTIRGPRRLSRARLARIVTLWCLPFLLAPPMYSKDVYSYLAQSEITARGMDPYVLGPAQALGTDHVFTKSVPTIWRDTPAPYGPLFLFLGRGIYALTGEHVVPAVIAHRILELGGVAMIVWALPRLARRCGVSEVAAIWLGAANPLLIIHLIAGIHNEALMLGLMLVGVELCLSAIDGRARLFIERRPTRALWLLIAGAAIITLSALIKVTSVLALGFVGIALARRWGATFPSVQGRRWRVAWAVFGRHWRPTVRAVATAAAALAAVMAAVLVIVWLVTGLDFGWLTTLTTNNKVRSWMSIPTILGVGTGHLGVLLGLGDHTEAILGITRPIALVAAVVIVLRMLLGTLAGRIHPIGALGLSMAAVVVLFPVVQPWYLLWAIVPLAAWATRHSFRTGAVAVSALVSVIVMPNGGQIEPFIILQAVITAIVVVALLMYLTFGLGIDRRLTTKWRQRAQDRAAASR